MRRRRKGSKQRMLRELSIRNFAIIDDLKICLSPGLTILSGETGAGKSIIINAVNLLLGSRASGKLIRTGTESAELEALFEIRPGSDMAAVIDQYGYGPTEELLVRRVISRSGQNRVHINGKLATMQILGELTQRQASISGQHAHQGLLKEDEHLNILDRFANLIPLRQEVHELYHQLIPLTRKLQELENKKQRQAERIELLRYQQQEIRSAAIEPGEDEQLEQELHRLKNAEALYTIVRESADALYSQRGAAVERLTEICRSLKKAADIDAALSAPAEEIGAASYHLEDIARELESYLGSVQIDENRLEAVEERLDALRKLKRKYGTTLEGVLTRAEAIDRELAQEGSLSSQIDDVREKIETLRRQLVDAAETLSQCRADASSELSRQVESELASLKMEKTKFEAAVAPISAGQSAGHLLTAGGRLLSETGMDRVYFQIAPNVGEEMKPLASIASGGELSRVVLALMAILSGSGSVETVVFDEVDAGIGGSVAETVGKKLAELARTHQVLCITHLPQIARFGEYHFRISKHVQAGRTVTRISALDRNERVEEIARMLGGEQITETTLKHASELIQR